MAKIDIDGRIPKVEYIFKNEVRVVCGGRKGLSQALSLMQEEMEYSVGD